MTTPASPPRSRYVDGLWHRLHPATPLLRGGIGLVAVLLYVGANFREHLVALVFRVPDVGGDPVDEISRRGLIGPAALVVLAVLVVGIGLFTVSWRASEFKIDGNAVTVRYGVLLRRTRTANLDRIQGVTISRPLLARIVGAARIELDVAGQNANVRLEYLSNGAAEALRRDVLQLASGRRAADRAEGDESLAAESAVLNEDGPTVVHVTPGRAVGSVLLSETTITLVVVAAIVLPTLTAIGAAPAAAVSFFPILIATVTVAIRRIGRNLRFTVVSTPDGVRVMSGVVSTSAEAVPPGRVHALRVDQPLLWRPAGWWRISVNRAGHTSGRGNAENERSLAPVATLEEVLALLPLLVPDLADRREAVLAGLVGRGRDEDFTPAPARARWLRPLAWRRTGFQLTEETVLARSGFLHRELAVVPDARMQSVSLRQGPLERLLRVATVHPHVVSGPVSTRLRLIDLDRAQRLFNDLAAVGVGARLSDVSHRWAEQDGSVVRPAGRLGVGVIGAGRVGPVLGAALAGAGHALVGVSAVSRESLDRADAMLPGAPVLAVPDLVERSELVLVAVPDDELPALVAGLADAGVWVAGQLVVHTAARYGTDVLLPAVRRGVIPVALSPAMAFTGTSLDLIRLRESRCAVTAPGPVLPIGQALAVEMGCEPVVVPEEAREEWAAALLAVTEPLEAAVRGAAARLARLGVEDADLVLGPMARSALERALGGARRPAAQQEDDE